MKDNIKITLALRELLELVTNAQNTESGKLSGNPYGKVEVINALKALRCLATGESMENITFSQALDSKGAFDEFMNFPYCPNCGNMRIRNDDNTLCWYCQNNKGE